MIGPERTGARPVALLLPGQGAQHQRMAVDLYQGLPEFADTVDQALALLGAEGQRLRADWLSDTPRIGIDDVRRAQPLLFAIDYALAQLVRGWGVEPVAYLGHSAGEVAAAAAAGTFTLPDAVALMAERIRHCAAAPAGGMLAVGADLATVGPYLTGEVTVAAENAARQVMLAGPETPLREVADRLAADGVTARPVAATTPFHSPALAPAATATVPLLRRLALRPPAVTVYSGYTGAVLTGHEAVDPGFWARQLTDPVWFRSALDRLLATGDLLLLEAGPGQSLSALARRHPAVRGGGSAVVAMLPPKPAGPGTDLAAVRAAAARLQTEGHRRTETAQPYPPAASPCRHASKLRASTLR